MASILELIEDKVADYGEGDAILDNLSDGDGEDFDSLEPPVLLDESFPMTVVVCNIPKVSEDKYDKLLKVITKTITKVNKDCEIDMPINPDTQMTDGFAIATFQNKKDADAACRVLDNMTLDKSHIFKCVKMDHFDDIVNRPDEFQPQRTLNSYSRADFRDWLADQKCREQFLLRYQGETEIYWHDTLAGVPVLCYGGEREKGPNKVWCDWRVEWSPQGSFITTFHKQGIALWAGPEFTKKMRLPHTDVKEILFAPNEDFVILWNGSHPSQNDDNAVKIFHVLTGQCMRACRTPAVTPSGEMWPHYLWSPDAKFIAECTDSRVIVRETENFEIIPDETGQPKPLKFDSLKTFSWSPKDNYLAVWSTEKDNNPARLVIVDIPSRREITSRSRTQCEAEVHWQSEGDYLCLQVTKLSKTKKKLATNLEIFRIRERGVPVDTVTIQEDVKGFFWECKGSRFAVLTADEQGHKPKLLIFNLGREKTENIACFDLPSASFNEVIWAPEGQYFVAASVASASGVSSSGDLLFGGLNSNNQLEILHKDEHYMLTDVQWDPSSRYVITAVTQPMQNDMGAYKFSMEAGYAIWTFQGRNLHRQQKEKLYGVSWRPHPPSMLPASKQKEIRKNIKMYSKKYDAMDDQAKENARQVFRRERETKLNGFLEVLDRLRDFKNDKYEENGWGDALEAFDDQQGWTQEEQIIEEELGVIEELIHSG